VLQHLLLPPLTGCSSRPGSEPPSPYLDVSIAMTAFTNSSSNATLQHPHSPLSQQQRRCYSPSQSLSPSSQLRRSSGASSPAWHRTSEGEAAADGRPAVSGTVAGVAGSTSLHSRPHHVPASAPPASRQSLHTAPAVRTSTNTSTSSKQQQQQQRCLSAVATSGTNVDAGLRRARRCRRGWDANTNPPQEPSFEDALTAWQEDTDAGVYGKRLTGLLPLTVVKTLLYIITLSRLMAAAVHLNKPNFESLHATIGRVRNG
jgi:hypothetical protein